MTAALQDMATIIWMVLAMAWVWHFLDLFRPVDPSELPPRARRRLGGDDPEPTDDWVWARWIDANLPR
jgi:hypothetical protein